MNRERQSGKNREKTEWGRKQGNGEGHILTEGDKGGEKQGGAREHKEKRLVSWFKRGHSVSSHYPWPLLDLSVAMTLAEVLQGTLGES